MIVPAPLTLRQMSVAVLISEGHTDKQVAALLDISIRRVGQHVEEIRDRMALDTALDARLLIAAHFARAA